MKQIKLYGIPYDLYRKNSMCYIIPFEDVEEIDNTFYSGDDKFLF